MKAIITVDVPEHQIGQEVSVYFKDTMYVNGTCESATEVYAKHDADALDKIKAEIEQMPSELTTDGRRMIRRGSVFRIIDKYKGVEE